MKIIQPSAVPAEPATSALFTGEVSRQPILTPEHATHVLEIILKSEQAANEGRALELETSF